MYPGKDEVLRVVSEALRDADPRREFWLALASIQVTEAAADHDLDAFPSGHFRAEVDDALERQDPDSLVDWSPLVTWAGAGLEVAVSAKGRSVPHRGATDAPSLNNLEPIIGDVVLSDGTVIRFIDLTLGHIESLISRDLELQNPPPGAIEWLDVIAGEMRHFGFSSVADAHPDVIKTWATSLGLV